MSIVPLLIAFAAFAFWILLGWALIAKTAPTLPPLQSFLLAPLVGVAATLLPTFWLSAMGFPVGSFARPLVVALLFLSVPFWVARRPSWSRGELVFILPAIVAVVLIGFPSLRFGLDWLANANDDWANYNLSAIRLLHDGLYQQPSIEAMRTGKDYPGYLWFLVVAGGGRPGADLLLALLAGVVGKNPFFVFMPLILAFHAVLCCAAGALASTALTDRRLLFSGLSLTAIAPLGVYAVHQQLIAQVIGVAFMCGIAALTCVALGQLRSIGRIVLCAVVTSAYCLAYPETVPFFVLAFLIFHGLHFRRGDWGWTSSWWTVPAVATIAAVLLGPYLVSFFFYLLSQMQGSAAQGVYSGVSIFPYFLVPSGLAVFFGLSRLGSSLFEPLQSLQILGSIVLSIFALWGVVIGLRRRFVPAAFLIVIALVAVALLVRRNDFGVFKVAMFSQVFLWFAILSAIACLSSRFLRLCVPVFAVLLLVTDVSYVSASWREDFGGGNAIAFGSRDRILTRLLNDSSLATCDVALETPLPPLIKILAARQGCGRVFDARPTFIDGLIPKDGAKERLVPFNKWQGTLPFFDASIARLSRGGIVLPLDRTASDGRSVEITRPAMPYPDTNIDGIDHVIWSGQDRGESNRLVLTDSNFSSYYYIPEAGVVSVYASERDLFFSGGMFAATGRYLLFKVKRPTERVRLQLDMTATIMIGSERELPPARAIGQTSAGLGLSGHGAARVVSEPFTPANTMGASYVFLDMGAAAKSLKLPRQGLMKLYGQDVALDYRQMVGFVRNIRLIDADTILPEPPSSVQAFPSDLANDALQFSGVYEDGWLGDKGFFVLSSDKPGVVVMRAMFPEGIGLDEVVLTYSVDGGDTVTRQLRPGIVEASLAVPAGRSRISFKFSAIGRLPGGDQRPAVVQLKSIAIHNFDKIPAPGESARVSLGEAVIGSSGVYPDGWQSQNSSLVVRSAGMGHIILAGMVPGDIGLEDQEILIKAGKDTEFRRTLQPGSFEVLVPALPDATNLSVSFAKSSLLPNGDGRRVSALLRSVTVAP